MTWREFWNQDTPIYVNERHRRVHCATVARQIGALLPPGRPVVLDFGCGEALSAEEVATRCGRLYLCDGAELVRSRLAGRLGALDHVVVLSPEQQDEITPRSVDLVVVNSVAQYLSRDDLTGLLATWRGLLAPKGRIVIADVIPPDVGPLTDVAALLRLGAANGFLLASIAGLVRTALSDYSRVRATLGLTHYREEEMVALLSSAGFDARRHHPNMGHNQARMAFAATRSEAR